MKSFPGLEDPISNSVVLRRPSKSILTAKVSIPRIGIYPCDKCGHRLSRVSNCHEVQKTYSRRPHSIHVDQDNYLYLQQINEMEFLKMKRKSVNNLSKQDDGDNTINIRPRSCHKKPEHIYEEIFKVSHMKTLDIKIKHSKDIKRTIDEFSDGKNDPTLNTLASDSSEKADSEFKFFDSTHNIIDDKTEDENRYVISKAKSFKKKFLARMTSLVSS